MKSFKLRFSILRKIWTVKVFPKKRYRKKVGKDSVAVTRLHKRCIILSHCGMDFETIAHELVHAYLYESCVYSSELNASQMEEFFCELMSKRGYEILSLAETLKDKIRLGISA